MSTSRAERLLAALLIALAAPAAGAAELATLFHTPQERERLDRLRRGEPEPPPAAEASASRPAGKPVVTGFVKRSDGRHTVWIDGAPVTVRGPQADQVLDPSVVRAYTDRHDESLKIERKPGR